MTTSTFGVTALIGSPLFTGTAPSQADVPGLFPVALAGRGFLLDLASDQFRHESIPLLRQQSDQSDQPGEGSVNPEDLWRRQMSSWHFGAGQRNLDIASSNEERFHRSKGVDPWTIGQFSLLPAVDQKSSTVNTNLFLAVAGSRLYTTDGASILYTDDITGDAPTWTNISGEPGGAPPSALTSDGYTVYSAHGASGIYTTTRDSMATASYATGTVTGVKYLKGRLFAWNGGNLYNVIAAGALPTPLLDHANSDFAWVDVAEATGFFYAAGFSGDKSTIYQTAVKEDATGLDVPIAAAELPDGEVVLSMEGYLGFLLIGTNLGIRFGVPDTTGQVQLGGLIDEAVNVRCFEGQGPFVWFGWSGYDSASTGLGRVDLSAFNGTRPAFASDLMVDGSGNVLSVATFQGRRVFTVAAQGVMAEDTDRVGVGYLEVGRIGYGLFDPKVSMYVTVSHEPLDGTISVSLGRDNGDYVFLAGEGNTAGVAQSSFPTGKARAESFDVRLELARKETNREVGPIVTRFTLRSYPVAARSERITVPLLLDPVQLARSGGAVSRSIGDDLDFLRSLEADGTSVLYQEGRDAYEVVVEDHVWVPHQIIQDGSDFTGTYYAKLKRFASE